jgi:hypothetical protein
VQVCVCKRERGRLKEGVSKREGERECVQICVCVCVQEREEERGSVSEIKSGCD